MKRVKVTVKTAKGSCVMEFYKNTSVDYLTDAIILKLGFPLNSDFHIIQNGNMLNYKQTELSISENDTIEMELVDEN